MRGCMRERKSANTPPSRGPPYALPVHPAIASPMHGSDFCPPSKTAPVVGLQIRVEQQGLAEGLEQGLGRLGELQQAAAGLGQQMNRSLELEVSRSWASWGQQEGSSGAWGRWYR